MSVEHVPDDARLWIEEAQARLKHARERVSGGDGRIYCEQAHYAAEMSIKGVIIANNHKFSWTHDISVLLDEAEQSGETIPETVQTAKRLTPYGGTGRYRFERDKTRTIIGDEETKTAINAATTTVTWASERVRTILKERDDRGQDTMRMQEGTVPLAKPGKMEAGGNISANRLPERPSAKHAAETRRTSQQVDRKRDDKTTPRRG